ncbi:kinase-like protein [Auriculariales sp. MPI-PUGE-AT-0066]|nr:kinase-like protein [Auriculariales sp. MPI-PUGE-AT-0066]
MLATRAPSPTATTSAATLAQLSRNASVISSSSSSSSSSSLLAEPTTPTRPRRAFSPPRMSRRPTVEEAPNTSLAPLAALAAATALKPKPQLALLPRSLGRTESGPPTPKQSGSTTPKLLATKADFDFGDSLGDGSYSEVVRATHKATSKLYAIKCISKMHLIRSAKVKYATTERDALALVTQGGHKGVIQLFWTFQDSGMLYFVLSLAPNGDLQSIVRSIGSLSLTCSRYYSAQIVDTITWIHTRGVVHRDIKPENILLDDNWRVKVADFGSAKLLRRGEDGAFVEDAETTRSFVGSPQFVSPELLLNDHKYACKSSDLYAAGCILFQLLTGDFLFSGQTEYLTFQKIKLGEHTPFPDWLDTRAADLIRALLPLNPADRLGATPKSNPNALKAHPFFSDARPEDNLEPVDWTQLWSIAAPSMQAGRVKKDPVPELTTNDWAGFGMTNESARESAVSLSDDSAVDEAADGVARLDIMPNTSASVTPSKRRGSAASSNASASTVLAALGIGTGLISRRGSTSHSSDGTGSTRSSDIPTSGVVPPEQMQPFLYPTETLVHATRAHIRRDVLRGLVRRDRPVALCLTSGGRVLAMQASSRKGWRTELVLALSDGVQADTATMDSEHSGSSSGTQRAANKSGVERGERVVRVEAGTGGDERCFTLRTVGQNHVFVAPDAQSGSRWAELLREAMTDGALTART